MYANSGVDTRICTNDVNATVGNTINGATVGFDVEDALYHKVDDSQLGLFRGPGTELFVTQNSGSIQRAIDIANAPYPVTEVNVKDGTYAENVVVNKALVLNGQGANTIINPGSGTTIDVTVAGVTLSNLHIYLYGAFTPFAGTAATNNTFTFRVLVKALLQGGYDAGTGFMRTVLATSLMPLSQPYGLAPYNVARFNYSGSELVANRTILTANSITDWVLVELYATTSGSAVARAAALLKNDGNVMDVDGTTPGVVLTETQDGVDLSHYIVIRHRNHFPVMSANLVSLPNAAAYDFTTSISQALGGDQLVGLSGGGAPFAIPTGDVDFNNGVGATDISAIVPQVGNTTYSVYDIDLNGGVGATDISTVVPSVGKIVLVH
jgi:hypothetical protein